MIRSDKLRNKIIESTHQPPYENLLLVDLPDERWEPFPVAPYDEHYVISNKGRVKRLHHITIKSNGIPARLQEKIIKQVVHYKYNRSLNEKTFFLTCKLGTLGSRKQFMTARMVYFTFVEPFDLEDPEWNVRYKDHNGLNCLPDNLYLFERCKLTQWVKDHKRVNALPPISKIWRKGMEPVKYPGLIDPVGVAKYSLTGELIEIFPTIVAAAQSMGISRTVAAHRMYGKHPNKKYILKAIDITQDPPAKIEAELTDVKIIDACKYGIPQGKTYPFQHISIDDLPGEQWKPIPDTDEIFWISDLGRIKSVDHYIHSNLHGTYLKTEKIVRQELKRANTKNRKYLGVKFSNRGKRVYYHVARLVYESFIGKIPKNHTVIYNDEDLFNCRAGNLIICSFSDSRKHFFQQRKREEGL